MIRTKILMVNLLCGSIFISASEDSRVDFWANYQKGQRILRDCYILKHVHMYIRRGICFENASEQNQKDLLMKDLQELIDTAEDSVHCRLGDSYNSEGFQDSQNECQASSNSNSLLDRNVEDVSQEPVGVLRSSFLNSLEQLQVEPLERSNEVANLFLEMHRSKLVQDNDCCNC